MTGAAPVLAPDSGLARCPRVAEAASQGGERVRAAEVMAALSLATDLRIGVPLELVVIRG
jgi:hypothetical protein